MVVGLTHLGVPVFAHVCHHQGKMWVSMVLPVKAPCSDEDDEKSCASTVCEDRDMATAQFSQKPCCEDQSALLKITSSYCSNLPVWENHTNTSLVFIPSDHLILLREQIHESHSLSPFFSDAYFPVTTGKLKCIVKGEFRC